MLSAAVRSLYYHSSSPKELIAWHERRALLNRLTFRGFEAPRKANFEGALMAAAKDLLTTVDPHN